VIAKPMGLSVETAALGIHRVGQCPDGGSVRQVSINRGFDPRQFSLVALGGGGPVHATALAGDLLLPRVIVPPFPRAVGVRPAGGADRARTRDRIPQGAGPNDLAESRRPWPSSTPNAPR